MADLENIYYLFGSNSYLRDRFKNLFLLKKESDGFNIEYLKDTLPNHFNLFFSKTLYILDPELFKDSDIISWLESLDTSIVLFISDTKFDFLVKKLKKENIREFKKPDFFNQAQEARSFFIRELKGYGKEISDNLASVIVQKCGTDYGILAFEALKLKYSSNNSSIEISDVQKSISSNIDAPLPLFLDSLSKSSGRDIARNLKYLPKSLGDGGVIALCAYITPSVLKWYYAGISQKEGKTVAESATVLGVNPWYYENTLLPAANAWGLTRLQALVEHLAKSHRLTLSGCLAPWAHFESGILALLG